MEISTQMRTIRDNTDYHVGSVHWNRRAFDKKFEIVARLSASAQDELGLSIGGEVVLDVRDNRHDALDSVRFFRRQEETA